MITTKLTNESTPIEGEPKFYADNEMPIGSRRIIGGNILWNSFGTFVQTVTGFIIAPFLVHQLGDSAYGMWILIASLTSYFGLLDLGMRASVGRQIAAYTAVRDDQGVNRVVSTSLATLLVAGIIAFIGAAMIAIYVSTLFEIPESLVQDSRIAILLVGLNLVLWLPSNVFDATLWGNQRFDVLNVIDITISLARLLLTCLFVSKEHGLIELAIINLVCLGCGQGSKGLACALFVNRFSIRTCHVHWGTIILLMNIGIWYFLVSLFRLFNNQLGAVIVGLAYGVASITGFSIATRMVGYATTIVVSGTGVLAPISSIFQSRSEQNRLNALFINGNLYCWSIALFVWGGCVFFGEALIVLWMGDDYRFTSYLLVILITGEAIPIAQLVTASVLQGMGKQKALAIFGIFEMSGIVLLNYVSAGPFGLVGVCYAFAIPALCTRGIAQMIIGCRAVGLPLKQYIIQVLLFSILPAIVPCAMAFAYTYYMSINSWFEFVAASIVYTLVFFASFRYRWIRR